MSKAANKIETSRTMNAKDGSTYSGVASREFAFNEKRISVESTISAHGPMGIGKKLAGLVRVNGYKAAEVETTVGATATILNYGFIPSEALATVSALMAEMHEELSKRSVAAWGW